MEFCALKMDFCVFSITKEWALVIGSVWAPIIFHHQGFFGPKLKSGSLSIPDILRGGGRLSPPIPITLPCMAQRSPYEGLKLILIELKKNYYRYMQKSKIKSVDAEK